MKPRATFVLPLLFALGLAAAAQTGNPGGTSDAPQASTEDVDAAQDQGSEYSGLDQILEGEEEVLSGGGYTYDPGNRRDPFKSLLTKPDRLDLRGPRPDGIPGLLIDEVDLTGVFKTKKGFVAQVKAANQNKSYLLREGDQLYDGDVVTIRRNEVVFKQIVQDPTALKPFREVVKTLGP